MVWWFRFWGVREPGAREGCRGAEGRVEDHGRGLHRRGRDGREGPCARLPETRKCV